MDLAPDFNEFIGCLIAHGGDFVIVGAYALAFHGRLASPAISTSAVRLARSPPAPSRPDFLSRN